MEDKDKKKFEDDLDEILDAEYEEVGEDEEVSAKENEKKDTAEESKETDDYEELKNQLLRLQADFTNYKRRTEKDRAGYLELGVSKLANDLFPVIDNLERALLNIEEYYGDDEVFKGITLIDDQLMEVLEKHDIEEIKAAGEKFDPNFHHAVAVVETDEVEPDVVVDVLQKGYKINDTVLRPSMVRVSK